MTQLSLEPPAMCLFASSGVRLGVCISCRELPEMLMGAGQKRQSLYGTAKESKKSVMPRSIAVAK